MKKTTLFSALLFSACFSFAQISFKTGNVELDSDLQSINAKAKLDIAGFKIDINKSYNLPIPKIDELLKIMEPAEIILANDISDVAKKPLDEVVSSYKTNKDKGWGAIAKDMGIKPGSPEFHALKGKTKEKTKGNSGKANEKGKANGASGKSKGNGKGKSKK